MSTKETILAAARDHFVSEREELLFVEVPEWTDDKGEPVKVYYRRRMSAHEFQRVTEGANMASGELGTDALFNAFFVCARDQDGRRLYSPREAEEAKKQISSDVVLSVVSQMGEIWEGIGNPKEY